jgi:hypothetical protein
MKRRATIPNHAERWTSVLDQNYWDKSRRLYFTAADATIVHKTAGDNATPAGNGAGRCPAASSTSPKSAYRKVTIIAARR